MKKNFYCNICQKPSTGTVLEVKTSRVHDIAVIKCDACNVESTCYLPPNTIPKITVERNITDSDE